MAVPLWIDYRELRTAEGDPNGYEDVFNRPTREIYAMMGSEHNDDGTHKTADFFTVECGQYAGNDADDRDITLTNTNLVIYFVMILAAGTQYPVFASKSMSTDDTKELGTAAFQADQIQSMGTGTFQVGTDATVNASGTDYDWFVIGKGVA